ncbi:hypothetical protein MLD38_008510 [Melastoma candidum]|uniref:Uncharacterized protein n=1 Tax=Melastoma candidum TaxID=119954 RepID=A0ACB9RUI6_9MYRT|nr:hypothetical protein MLD38_008510 [Melastoma candidum]
MEDQAAERPDFRLEWDVFLSFRGTDTRHEFVEPLYEALRGQGIRPFRDDKGMNRGDVISPTLIRAIEDSAAAIVIISPDYASSHWCLDELVKIHECKKLMLPVFYLVEPRHVRHQTGPFEESFQRHEAKFEEDRVMSWRSAMKAAGGISGWEFTGRHDREMHTLIQALIERIQSELRNSPLYVAPFTVGLESRIEQLVDIMSIKSGGVKVIGLYGLGGVGKTTLAKALYNKLVTHFENRCFISDVRENFRVNGAEYLRTRMFRELAPEEPSRDVALGKRVLIVLDDVDDIGQVDAILGRKEWYYEGSRIIITTRNTEALGQNHVTDYFEVRELFPEDALQLFCYHALKNKKPSDAFAGICNEMVELAGKLPLALEVFGSYLLDKRTMKEWESALEKLKRVPPNNLSEILKISYDGLDDNVKYIFLDVACLFIQKRMKREDIIDVLSGCDLNVEIGMGVLVSRSLIKTLEDGTVWLHDQVRDMGRAIVLQGTLQDPGLRSRLWDHQEISSVLKDGKGTRYTQGLVLDYDHKPFVSNNRSSRAARRSACSVASAVRHIYGILKKPFGSGAETDTGKEERIMFRTEHFKPMVNLRGLRIDQVNLEGAFKILPQSLKWLQWRECPLSILPSDFCVRELTFLDLSRGKFKHMWTSKSSKVAGKLKILILRECHALAGISDLSGFDALEKIVLELCTGLTQLHESVGSLKNLIHLNLKGCRKLTQLPRDVSGLMKLKELILSDCFSFTKLPEDMNNLKSLKVLLLDNTKINRIPEKIFHLVELEKLHLRGCSLLKQLPELIGQLESLKELILDGTGIETLPDSIGALRKLEILSLMRCASLTELPDSLGDLILLREMYLLKSPVRELPASLGNLSYLKTLLIRDCRISTDTSVSMKGLASLVDLQLGGEKIDSLPNELGLLGMLRRLEIRDCTSLVRLPESIGNLSELVRMIIVNVNITELPESIGELGNLVFMRLTRCKNLDKLPESIGNLKSLYHLYMEETSVTKLPESFGGLANLRTLRMGKKPLVDRPSVDPGFAFPCSFANLSHLEEINARAWYMTGRFPDDFEKLESLETLNLGYNNFSSLPSSLKGLTILKELLLPHCKELKSLPPLPSSLTEINIAECHALESISDVSALEKLEVLNMSNCQKVTDIPGVECLKSLQRLYLTGCTACSSTIRRRISKVCLRNWRVLNMPGSELPSWLCDEEVTYEKKKNHVLKAVLVGVVYSINNNFPEPFRYEVPVVPGIQAKILNQNGMKFSTTLPLMGIPKTNEDQITAQSPPRIPGIELKKGGVCLVFETDDEYKGDERLLDESYISLSEKLARFLNSQEVVA